MIRIRELKNKFRPSNRPLLQRLRLWHIAILSTVIVVTTLFAYLTVNSNSQTEITANNSEESMVSGILDFFSFGDEPVTPDVSPSYVDDPSRPQIKDTPAIPLPTRYLYPLSPPPLSGGAGKPGPDSGAGTPQNDTRNRMEQIYEKMLARTASHSEIEAYTSYLRDTTSAEIKWLEKLLQDRGLDKETRHQSERKLAFARARLPMYEAAQTELLKPD